MIIQDLGICSDAMQSLRTLTVNDVNPNLYFQCTESCGEILFHSKLQGGNFCRYRLLDVSIDYFLSFFRPLDAILP